MFDITKEEDDCLKAFGAKMIEEREKGIGVPLKGDLKEGVWLQISVVKVKNGRFC